MQKSPAVPPWFRQDGICATIDPDDHIGVQGTGQTLDLIGWTRASDDLMHDFFGVSPNRRDDGSGKSVVAQSS